MVEFKLTSVPRTDPDGIRSEWMLVDRAQTGEAKVLVVRFVGTYPPGSAGSRHGGFIAREALTAMHTVSPSALVLDFTELDYSWGDTMLRVFQDVSQLMDEDVPKGAPHFPIVVVVSERSGGVHSLLGPRNPTVFADLNHAIEAAIAQGTLWQAW